MTRITSLSILLLLVVVFGTHMAGAETTTLKDIHTILPAMGDALERPAPCVAPTTSGLDECRGWPVNLSAPGAGFPYTPTLYDADGDGADEIFLTGGHTFGLRGDGTFLPGWPTTEMVNMGYGTNGTKPGPSVANMDNAGDCEVLWSLRDWYAGSSYMWCFNGKNFDATNLPGFPQEAPDESSNALAVPFVVGDTDEDGDLEVWGLHTLGNTGTHDRLSGFDHEGTRLFTRNLGHDESALSLYFGDLDGNGTEEMFATTMYDSALRLYLFQANGIPALGYPHTLHTYSGGYLPIGPPIPVDLDHDGDLEILHSYWDGGGSHALCHHHDGTPCTGFPIDIASSSQLFYIGLGDITGDGNPELIATDNHLGYGYRIHVIDIATGTALPGWPLSLSFWPKGFPTVVDITNDGLQEICFVTDGGELYAVSGNAVIVQGYPKQMASASISGVGAGDIDGDGLFELVAATWDGLVYAWDTDGEVLPGRADWPMQRIDERNTGVFTKIDLADVVQEGDAAAWPRLCVHPNPAPAFVSFSMEASMGPLTIEIYDPSGRKIDVLSGSSSASLRWQPRSTDPAGIYLARPIGSDRGESVRFVVLR